MKEPSSKPFSSTGSTGSFAGPVECLLSTDVYSNDRQHLLIPAGSKLLGETKKVDTFGQTRLAVVFHRLIMPDGYSVSLDQFKGLNQIGDTGLRDQVNNHYLRIFGVSLAIGALGAVAKRAPAGALTQRAATSCARDSRQSTAQSSAQILDKFLNIMPTVTIREGHRVKVYLAGDLACPTTSTTKCLPISEGRERRKFDEKKDSCCSCSSSDSALVPPPRNSGAGSSTTQPTTKTRCFATTSSSSTSQLQKSYAKITTQLNLAMQMATFIRNMPARYRALFSQWRNVTSLNTFGNTVSWINGINSGLLPNINTGYQKSTTQLLPYSPDHLSGMDPFELERVQSQYASVELADGANINAMATIGSIRGNAQDIQTQIGNLEQDSFSSDSGLNSEVSVLNKINAAGVLTLRTVQDSNKLLASLLEHANHPCQAAARGHHQLHQCRHPAPSQPRRQHDADDRHPHQFTSNLPHAVRRAEIDARASKELTAVQTDYLQFIFQAINTLLTQNLGFFDAMGQNLFRSFATILVAWYGIKSALSAASGKYPFQFDNFASLLLTISFGFAMVNYYNAPIPGVGVSFHNLVTNEAQFLSGQIDQAQLQTWSAQSRTSSRASIRRLGEIFSERPSTSS